MESQSYLQGNKTDGAESIKVLVRVRPLNQAELADNNDSVVSILNDQSLNVSSADGKKSFRCSFDSVLGPNSTQSDVYGIVRSCTESVLDGFNATIFAYGQTGSGKTHSMYGPPNYASASNARDPRNAEMMGLIPRAVDEIFELVNNRSITDFQVHCSFVQIYNENLYDMLRDSSMNTPLSIRDNNKEIYVQGISEYNVKSVADTLQLLKVAEENRAIRETNMNMFSSRSHSIFQILVEHKRVAEDGGEISYRAKFNLVDLAGSEKWNTKLQMRDEHIAEMTNINLSLHTLGKCISALAQASQRQNRESESRSSQRERADSSLERSMGSLDHSGSTAGSIRDFPVPKSGRYSGSGSGVNAAVKEPSTHVPFRESKLTRLLQDSLGGNAKTFLIATVSPARANSEESISTLKFADRAKQVMVQAVINETRPVDYALVKRLQQEVEMLKGMLKRLVQSQNTGNSNSNGAGSPGQFNAKLKQATTTLDFQDLFTSPPRSSSVPSGASSPQLHLSNPHYLGVGAGADQPSYNNGNHNGTQSSQNNPNLNNNINANVPAGGGLEYVISLEKALNQEQIHSQHLHKKNETLIKELEELKFQNMQMLQAGKQGALSAPLGSPPPLNKSISINSLAITSAQVTQVISSVQALLKENAKLMEQTEQVQKIMKKFFKFQIEEEDMKGKMEAVFTAVKEIKATSASSNVVDNFAFLEFLATHVGKSNTGGSPPKPVPREASPPLYTQSQSQAQSQPVDSHTGAGAGRKQLRRTTEPAGGPQLPAMQGAAPLNPTGMMSQGISQSKSAGKNVGMARQVQAPALQQLGMNQNHHHHQSLPSLGDSSGAAGYNHSEFSSSNVPSQRRDNFSAGSDGGYSSQVVDDFSQFQISPAGQSYQAHTQPQQAQNQNQNLQQQQQQFQPGNAPQPDFHIRNPSNYSNHGSSSSGSQLQAGALNNNSSSSNFGLMPSSSQYAVPQPLNSLSYRVRGGLPNHPSGPLSNSSQNSLQSSGGWVVAAEEDAAAAEERLKQELKKAKKKIKKQQKMQDWQRIKEEKQKADLDAEIAQRAAEEEAELQRELKRKQYAQKAKNKLDAYHAKVKTEAEKIQELKNLGIDPNSLF